MRRTYRFEQSRENLIAIFQRRDFVAFQQGRAEQISHRSDENIVSDCIVSDDFVVDLLLSRKEIAGDNERRAPPKAAAPRAVGDGDWREQKGRYTQKYGTAGFA